MLQFNENSATSAVLSQALLIYTNQAEGPVIHASLHTVVKGVVQPCVKPLTMKALKSLEQSLRDGLATTRSRDLSSRVWPANVLLNDPQLKHIAWFVPGHACKQFFKCPELGTRAETLNLPSMVFVQKNDMLYLCAIEGSSRPDDATPVFHAPMFNTYQDGSVCLGQVNLPFPETPAKMLSNQVDFFRGVNTHPNGHHSKTTFKFGIFALWKKLLDKPATRWNDAWLTPQGQTLHEWLNKVLK